MKRAVCAGALLWLVLGAVAQADPGPPLSPRRVVVERPRFVAAREGRYFVVELQQPHRVLSTSTREGGQSEVISHLVNMQSMEARAHDDRMRERLRLGSRGYHDGVSKRLAIAPRRMALMGTAAHLDHLAHATRQHEGLVVDAFVTAGVRGNAVRAGDPARWVQRGRRNKLIPEKGTINLMVLINQPLLPGAQLRAVTVAVEAKTAALAQLAVGSRYSEELATGTGTDQLIVAAPLTRGKPLESASPHVKLGELIGSAVLEATLQALRWQNDLSPSRTSTVVHALGRFGLTDASLRERLSRRVTSRLAPVALANLGAIGREPRLVAAAYAYATVLDRLRHGTLARGVAVAVLRDQAATAAAAVAQQPEAWPRFWRTLDIQVDDPLDGFARAIAAGFEAKWAD